jgi:cytochrome oxidase Cu insertion factor (SCO1/SenC/PrrC family)
MEAGAQRLPLLGRRGVAVPVTGLLTAAVLLGAGLGFALHLLLHRSAAAPTVTIMRNGLDGQATWAPGTRPAPPINALADQTGRPFALSALHGQTVALVFVDSHCNQQCPLEGRELSAAERALPAGQRPILVAVSVNPLDTPASVRKAARAWGLASVSGWHWLMGSRAELAPVWRAYHIYVGDEVGGDIPHTEAVVLVDRRGYERSAYLYPFNQGFVTHDLRVLARERRA